MSKLKFTFLELQTKRRFLEHVSDEQAWSAIPVVWAPGPLKALELQAQSAKDALKTIKEAQADTKQAIEQTCDVLAQRLSECIRKRGEAVALIAKVRELLQEINTKQMSNPGNHYEDMSTWSIPELKHKLDTLKVEVEKKKAALSVQRQAVSDLDRLLSHQSDQLDRQHSIKCGLEEEIGTIKSSPQSTGAIAELCRWYRSMTELTEEMTGVHCEVVRPDYLHVTVTNPQNAASVPIHLNVDPVSGKLQSVSVHLLLINNYCVDWKYCIHPQNAMAGIDRFGHQNQRHTLTGEAGALQAHQGLIWK